MADNWIQHTLQRTGWRPRNQAIAMGVIGVVIALLFGALYLSQVVSFATTNREIEVLLAERDALELNNEQLRAEIASWRTVPVLLARAQELGFRPAESGDIEYLVIEGYNPYRSESVIPLEEAQENDVPVYDQTFGGWIQQQWDNLRRQFESFGSPSNEP